MPKDTQSRKYQLTINNPAEHGLDHDTLNTRLAGLTSLVYACLADEKGLEEQTPHTHIYLVTQSPVRFSTIKNRFPEAHIEAAHGTSEQNRDYVGKTGKWADDEKADTSISGTFEEIGAMPDEPGQGSRTELEEIGNLIEDGYSPDQIMQENFAYRRYERMIRSAYFSKRKRETPTKRDVKIHYLVGESGSGKSYTYVTLCEEQGEDDIFFLTDYDGGGFDTYCGEPVLFMDEYKGQFPFGTLLTITDVMKAQVHARYTNVTAIWSEVYITSVFPPEELYKKMVVEDIRGRDKQQQLMRRITDITYCFIDTAGEYQKYTVPMGQYTDYDELKAQALEHIGAEAPTPTWTNDTEETTQTALPF